jgi:DNA-binding HxlR family transcriptional regulator
MGRSTTLEAGGACSIARTLGVVGERWSLLVVREAVKGRTRFSEFQDALKVSTDILADRLESLVEVGVLERREYREPGSRSRHGYHLTPMGVELLPVLGALLQWGNDHLAGEAGAPSLMRRRGTDVPVRVALVDDDGQTLEPHEVEVIRGPGAGVPLPLPR